MYLGNHYLTERVSTKIDGLSGNMPPITIHLPLKTIGPMTTFLMSIVEHEGKVAAIKMCRTITGLGLKEAKIFVEDQMAATNTYPE